MIQGQTQESPDQGRDTAFVNNVDIDLPGEAVGAIERGSGAASDEKFAVFGNAAVNRDSLSENFNHEIEAWARHALGANGFGDYPR